MPKAVHDDCGRSLLIPDSPQRIVSLCPSITETLLSLGANERVVGRTRYCVHPAERVRSITEIGGTKNPAIQRVAALQPDLIIAEKEENRAEDVAALQRLAPVYVFDIVDFRGALAMIDSLGEILPCALAATDLRDAITAAWAELPRASARRRCLYFIWRKPWMVAGSGTYIDAVLERLGFDNLARGRPGRYPELSPAWLAEQAPETVLLSSEPYPFVSRHRAELQAVFPGARIELVDGEMYSWYGARMLLAGDYLAAGINRP